ncbi:MAG: rod shape-determining protein MreD [Thiohalocapsa sp.]|jgi:rod shape-determining protein MreD|nr:rod shape-determining protein MreD [Thiohalocapsa sp.]MCF7988920.1 rod shape-determining protein MreD [Thiohalocapsa sp.]
MTASERRGTALILASFGLGLLLTLLPLPHWAAEYRPQWVTLVLIFWVLSVPRRVGVFAAFAAGLVLDVVTGTVLGQHALTLSVVGFLAVELRQRILPFPAWQQALSVWVLLLVERLLSLWILGATGQPTPSLDYWVPTVIGMLLWPWLLASLESLRERFGPA